MHLRVMASTFQSKTSNMKVEEEKPFLCDNCCKAFMTWDEFNAHGNTKHDKNFASIRSGKTTPSETCQGNDVLMKITEQDKKPQVCDECGEAFMDSDSFIAHKEEHRKEQLFVCAECKRIFTMEEDLDRHLEKHNISTAELMNKKKLDNSDPNLLQTFKIFHQNTNGPNAISFKSEFASCTSKGKDEINAEPKSGKLHQSNECEKSFNRRLELTSHEIQHNDSTTSVGQKTSHLDQRSNVYQCNQCNKAVGGELELTQHLVTSRGEKSHQCDKCGKTFKGKDRLIVNFRTLSGEKPFRCDQCEKTFGNKCQMTNHLRTHNEEKPHQCYQCDKAFARKNHLKRHFKTHSGEKPFKCEQCDNSFSSKQGLTYHLRTHSGEKPFQCNLCDNTFRDKCSMTSHLRTHNEKNVIGHLYRKINSFAISEHIVERK